MSKRLLLVEDHTQIRNLVKLLLRSDEIEVTEAPDGGVAISALDAATFDLILLDLMIPVLDGYEVLKHLRADDRHKDTPVIVLTSRAQEADIDKGYALGATLYITKPFEPKDLVAQIRTSLGLPERKALLG